MGRRIRRCVAAQVASQFFMALIAWPLFSQLGFAALAGMGLTVLGVSWRATRQ